MNSFPILAAIQAGLLLAALFWFIKRNDEVPLIVSAFLTYCSSYRYWAVTMGFNEWLEPDMLGLSGVTDGDALEALNYIILGQFVLLAAYMFAQRKVIPLTQAVEDAEFIKWLRPKTLVFGACCLPLVVFARSSAAGQAAAGQLAAFEISGYTQLFPLVLIGVMTIIACLWRFNGLDTQYTRLIAGLIFVGVLYLSFNISGRFQFLGWLLSLGIIVASQYGLKKKVSVFLVLVLVAGVMFGAAGALRGTTVEADDEGLARGAVTRVFSAEDANMLDGFVLVQEVYPERLDYGWGWEHLQILLRPIPRSWWPDKPAGGYVNKLGLYQGEGTIGFSPTLLGSFYEEGGLVGIVVLALIYGFALGSLISFSARIKPFAGVMIRAAVCASLIPLLRGGDLPGIYAWIGMAFWPCVLLLWLKRKELIRSAPPAAENRGALKEQYGRAGFVN
jgi:oligosaccharide repeat unit polymerase